MIGIAGGGIGGLSLAVALQSRGVDVVVYERQEQIREAGAGISLWPNALAALDSIGLGDAVRSIGLALSSGGLRKLDGRSAATFSAASFRSALGEGLVCVHRGELIATLAGMLAPGTVRTGQEVTGYEVAGTGARLLLSGGDGEVLVDALVGADGIHSAVARRMSGALPQDYSGYTAWRGVAGIDPERGNGFWACLSGGHEFGWLPLRDGRTYWFATAWLPADHILPEGDGAYLASVFGNWPKPVPDLVRATPADQLVRNDIVDRAMPPRLTHGPVALIGDAAHPMRPHLGQGGCQAIEDAATLAACLASHSRSADAFRTFERLRRRRAAKVVRMSKRSGFTRPAGAATAVMDRVTSLLPALPVGGALRTLAPIAGYRAGARAVVAGR